LLRFQVQSQQQKRYSKGFALFSEQRVYASTERVVGRGEVRVFFGGVMSDMVPVRIDFSVIASRGGSIEKIDNNNERTELQRELKSKYNIDIENIDTNQFENLVKEINDYLSSPDNLGNFSFQLNLTNGTSINIVYTKPRAMVSDVEGGSGGGIVSTGMLNPVSSDFIKSDQAIGMKKISGSESNPTGTWSIVWAGGHIRDDDKRFTIASDQEMKNYTQTAVDADIGADGRLNDGLQASVAIRTMDSILAGDLLNSIDQHFSTIYRGTVQNVCDLLNTAHVRKLDIPIGSDEAGKPIIITVNAKEGQPFTTEDLFVPMLRATREQLTNLSNSKPQNTINWAAQLRLIITADGGPASIKFPDTTPTASRGTNLGRVNYDPGARDGDLVLYLWNTNSQYTRVGYSGTIYTNSRSELGFSIARDNSGKTLTWTDAAGRVRPVIIVEKTLPPESGKGEKRVVFRLDGSDAVKQVLFTLGLRMNTGMNRPEYDFMSCLTSVYPPVVSGLDDELRQELEYIYENEVKPYRDMADRYENTLKWHHNALSETVPWQDRWKNGQGNNDIKLMMDWWQEQVRKTEDPKFTVPDYLRNM
jgi:hypothetical protein